MSGEIKIFQLALERLIDDVAILKEENQRLNQRVESVENKNSMESISSIDDKLKDHRDDVLLDTKEVRKFLRVSHNTLQAIVRSGKLKQIRLNERNIRYSKNELERYVLSL
jgi:hypothetical protein